MPRPVRLLPLAISLYLSMPDGAERGEGEPTDYLPPHATKQETERFLSALRTVWQREVAAMPEPDKSAMSAYTFGAELFDGVPLIYCKRKRGLFNHAIVSTSVANP